VQDHTPLFLVHHLALGILVHYLSLRSSRLASILLFFPDFQMQFHPVHHPLKVLQASTKHQVHQIARPSYSMRKTSFRSLFLCPPMFPLV
jgi:hypothetical protein